MTASDLTGNEAHMLKLLAIATVRGSGVAPTLRELGQDMGMSSTGHLGYIRAALAEKGLVTYTIGMHRSTRLTAEGMRMCQTFTTPGGRNFWDAIQPQRTAERKEQTA